MEAIEYETDLLDDDRQHLADNAVFFQTVLPGRAAPLGARQASRRVLDESASKPP